MEKKRAILVLHEIYGVNDFMKRVLKRCEGAGFDAFCPDLLGRPPFPYEQTDAAYQYFRTRVGFDAYRQVGEMLSALRERYESVWLLGFSAGATLAWRCCEMAACSGIVGCYGSRIRDYPQLHPVCPTLLLFAREPSFSVEELTAALSGRPKLTTLRFEAEHGFLDADAEHFNARAAAMAEDAIFAFLSGNGET